MTTAFAQQEPASAELGEYTFSVEQYHRLIEEGIFSEHDRVQLVEGRIVHKMTHNPRHDESVWRLQNWLVKALPEEWIVRVQSAITLSKSEPEPDLVIARRRPAGYAKSHPTGKDIRLVIEVADSSLAVDSTLGARIFAADRIPEYWIVNLINRRIEIYSAPRAGTKPRYTVVREYLEDDIATLALAEGVTIAIAVREVLS